MKIPYWHFIKKFIADRKTKTVQLFYKWELSQLSLVCDQWEALKYRKDTQSFSISHYQLQSVPLYLFWEEYKIQIPYLPSKKSSITTDTGIALTNPVIVVTKEIMSLVEELSTNFKISDQIFAVRSHLLSKYEIGMAYWIPLLFALPIENKINSQQETSIINFRRYLEKKRFLDGMIRIDPFSEELPLGDPMQIILSDNPNVAPSQVYWWYVNTVHTNFFYPDPYKIVNKVWPEQYKQMPQYNVEMFQGLLTCTTMCRRMWKSYDAVDKACLSLFQQSFDKDYPQDTMYITIQSWQFARLKQYVEWFMKPLIELWYVKCIWWTKDLIVNLYDKPRWNIIARIVFWGTLDKAWVVGNTYRRIIVDETERVPDEIMDDIEGIKNNDWVPVSCYTTLNRKSNKDSWYYKKLVKWEMEEKKRQREWRTVYNIIDEYRAKYDLNNFNIWPPERKREIHKIVRNFAGEREYVWLRYSWWECDLRTDEEKKKKDKLNKEAWDHVYFPEWLSIFPDEANAIEYEQIIIQPEQVHEHLYTNSVFALDIARKIDYCWWLFWWYNEVMNTIDFLEDFMINRDPEMWCVEIANAFFEWFDDKPPLHKYVAYPKKILTWVDPVKYAVKNIDFIWDWSWLWWWYLPYYRMQLKPLWIKLASMIIAAGKIKWSFNQEYADDKNDIIETRLSKSDIIDMFIEAINSWYIRISSKCTNFLEDLNNLKNNVSPEWGHFDFWNAAIYLFWYLRLTPQHNLREKMVKRRTERNNAIETSQEVKTSLENLSFEEMQVYLYRYIQKQKWLDSGTSYSQLLNTGSY